MPTEVYKKTSFGRRVRKITQAVANGLEHISSSLYSSLNLSAPVNTTPNSIAGAAGATTVGTVFTNTPGIYTGSAPITVTRQWLRNGAVISGQTGATLNTASGYTAGQQITCRETATNAVGSIQVTSNSITLT